MERFEFKDVIVMPPEYVVVEVDNAGGYKVMQLCMCGSQGSWYVPLDGDLYTMTLKDAQELCSEKTRAYYAELDRL